MNTHMAAPPLPSTGVDPLPPEADIAPGYRVVALLRRGRDLDTYDLWSEARQCRCVGKIVREDRANPRRVATRLLQEGSLLQELTHPHIVRCYDVVASPRPLVVLETLPGETLSHLIGRRQRRLVMREVLVLGLQLCSAVGYLHYCGILHLDLKPSNVVASHGMAKVLDLSVARRIGTPGGACGTRGYRAPEQLAPGGLGTATDVWGIGVTLFEVIAGIPAWWERKTSRHPTALQEPLSPGPVCDFRRVPPTLATLIDGCLAHESSSRPTVEELARGLETLLTHATASSSAAPEACEKR